MNERDDPTRTETPDEMRPLPDGGLSEAMPEWLRRPPAWRDLPRKDEPAAQKTLPDPDTSVIDPRELVTIDDLPQWLRDIAARESAAEPEPVVAGPESPAEPLAPAAPEPQTVELVASPEHATRPKTEPWIWALRAAVILIILSIIYYVFIL